MKNNIYATIEVGSYEVKMLVCNLREERLFVLAQKCVPSVGIERGQITNLDKLVGQIKKLKELVEVDLQQPVKNLILTMPPIEVAIEHTLGRVNLDVKQPISAEDVRKLFRQLMNTSHHEGHFPIGLIPRLFKIDENHVVQNPRGLSGMNLGLEASRILMPATTVANLVHAVERAGFKVDDIIVGSIAQTMANISSPEGFARTCDVNVGHDMTTITIVNDGKIIHANALSIGGSHLTRGIMDAFGITAELATELKNRYGKVISHTGEVTDHQVIHIDETKELFITRGMLNEVITVCADQLFQVVRGHIVDELRLREQEYQYTLTGGSAELPNLIVALQNQLPMVATVHRPSMLGVRDAKFATLVGVTIFAHEITLLLDTKAGIQTMDFSANTPVGEKKLTSKQDVIPHVGRVTAPQNKIDPNYQPQSLKDAIAGATPVANKPGGQNLRVQPKKMPLFDDLDEPFAATTVLPQVDNYMDQKLENSGVLARFFGKILNETEEETQD